MEQETVTQATDPFEKEITERQRTEAALKESLAQIERAKQEWEATADSLPQLIALLDDRGCIIRANRTVESWQLGQVVNVKGQAIHKLLHPACSNPDCYLEHFWSQARAKLGQGQPITQEVEDGLLERYLHLQIRPVLAETSQQRDKVVTSFAIAVVDDITARKRAEEALKKAKDELEIRVAERTIELREANKRLRFELSERERLEERLEAIYQLGEELTLLRNETTILQRTLETATHVLRFEVAGYGLVNEATRELEYRYHMVGGHLQAIEMHLPLDGAEARGIGVSVVHGGEAINVPDTTEDVRYVFLSKGQVCRSELCVPMRVGERVIGVLNAESIEFNHFTPSDQQLLQALADQTAVALENARLYEVEQERFQRLQQSQAQLLQVEKMAAIGRLVASIAHEINNPLQAIQNALDLLEEELETPQQPTRVNHFLDVAGDEIDRVSGIVNRMRDFYRQRQQAHPARLDSNSIDDFYRPKQAELQAIDLHGTLVSVLQLTNKQLQNSGVTVEKIWTADLPPVQGNPDHLKQVFLNLILNAVDSMAPQGGTLRLRTAPAQILSSGDERVPAMSIEVSDTGAGMAPEIVSRLFEPLVTTKEQGSGFGLFTSYKIIEGHHGQITVQSHVGLGTSFTILLPIKQPL